VYKNMKERDQWENIDVEGKTLLNAYENNGA
jgi:hypothetical protein